MVRLSSVLVYRCLLGSSATFLSVWPNYFGWNTFDLIIELNDDLAESSHFANLIGCLQMVSWGESTFTMKFISSSLVPYGTCICLLTLSVNELCFDWWLSTIFSMGGLFGLNVDWESDRIWFACFNGVDELLTGCSLIFFSWDRAFIRLLTEGY